MITRRILQVACLTLALLIVAFLGAWAFKSMTFERQRSRLGLARDQENLEAFIGERLAARMTEPQVRGALGNSGYDKIEFYLTRPAASTDSVIVERFVYSVPWTEDAHINVLFSKGRVYDWETNDKYLRKAVRLSASVALPILVGEPQ